MFGWVGCCRMAEVGRLVPAVTPASEGMMRMVALENISGTVFSTIDVIFYIYLALR